MSALPDLYTEASSLWDALPSSVLLLARDGTARQVNAAFCDFVGVAATDALGTGWQDALPEVSRRALCAGCHLPIQANWKSESKHYEGKTTRNWASYNPQVARDEMYQIGKHGDTKGNIIVPVRSSSALILSSTDINRQKIYIQQPPTAASGYSSQAFAPHFPHTVQPIETRRPRIGYSIYGIINGLMSGFFSGLHRGQKVGCEGFSDSDFSGHFGSPVVTLVTVSITLRKA